MLSINNIIGSVKELLTLPIILFIEFIRFIKLKVHKVCRPLQDILVMWPKIVGNIFPIKAYL